MINPVLAKFIVSVIANKKSREKLIIGIVTGFVLFLFLIILPIYLLIYPFEAISTFFSDINNTYLNDIQTIRENYIYTQQGILEFKGMYPLPVEGKYVITSEFGIRNHPIYNVENMHTGIDIVGNIYCNILAVEKGEVILAGVNGGYGNFVNIKHTREDGTFFYSAYGHLAKIYVQEGQVVTQGQIIGIQGRKP